MDQNISKYFRIFSTERQAASKVDQLDLDRIFLSGTKTARWSRETWKDDFLRTKFLSLLLLIFVVVRKSCIVVEVTVAVVYVVAEVANSATCNCWSRINGQQ